MINQSEIDMIQEMMENMGEGDLSTIDGALQRIRAGEQAIIVSVAGAPLYEFFGCCEKYGFVSKSDHPLIMDTRVDPYLSFFHLTDAGVPFFKLSLERIVASRRLLMATQRANGGNALHLAAAMNDCKALEDALHLGVDVNELNARGESPLHIVSDLRMEGEAPIEPVRLLIERGSDTLLKDHKGKTALHHAAEAGNLLVAQLLLLAGGQLEARDNNGRTPLLIAASYADAHHIALMSWLVSVNADVHAVDNEGSTALHRATVFGSAEAMAVLLKAGANVEAIERGNMRPLHYAAMSGDPRRVGLLLAYGAKRKVFDSKNNTPVMIASQLGRVDALRILQPSLGKAIKEFFGFYRH